ncbi:roadblock/LC7 domain-containing protein [Kitasatospora sp. RG8]|uniref:roadblock/LC7 domain-containing protein n=1 Tax=Kitasatospora sp. RG8 TaxID=2820815 RepID=UPI001ADF1AE8|nr:roadblock/LC7 domain-containing protein [Kitasatospora sp. RG8]MBP0450800.1 roadblock/LC7 domain-containing protein [Kitasatospora sp. RG8]
MTDRHDQLAAEVRVLRDRVVGVTDVVVASVDGLVITSETDETAGAEGLAALTAASFSIARRAGSMSSKGRLHHTVSQFTDGYLVARAVGDMALIGVLGDAGMDVQRLQAEAQESAERISVLLTAASGQGEADHPHR